MSGWVVAVSGIIVAVVAGISSLWVASITRHASPYDSMVKRVSDQDDRIDELEAKIDALRTKVNQAEDAARASAADAHESRNVAEQSLEENVAWADHHIDTLAAVAALRRPWPEVPVALRHRLSRDDYPFVPIITAPDERDTPTHAEHLDVPPSTEE